MMIPSSVRVGSFDYAVKEVAHVEEGSIGLCMPDQLTIYVQQSLPPQRKWQIFWHELLHAMWHAAGLHEFENPSEEQVVALMSYQIARVLSDNPALKEAF